MIDVCRALTLKLLLPLLFVVLSADARAQKGGQYEHYTIYDGDHLSPSEYAKRRKKVLEKMEQGSAMLVRSADFRNRSNDVDYEFRQRNNLLYLTGVTEDRSALLLLPDGYALEATGETVHEILFVAGRNPSHEIWEGIRMGPEIAAKVTGLRTVLEYSELRELIQRMLPTLETLYYDDWVTVKIDDPVAGLPVEWKDLALITLQEDYPNLAIKHAGKIVHGLRMIKSPAEIAIMQKAVDITVEAHREAMRASKPGTHEYEVEAVMEYVFRRLGAQDPGYPSIVGSGPNTCILHYSTNRRQSETGDLVLMDCGAEYHGYSADITRTFPVSGTFTPEQRAIYDLVLEAQNAAIAGCVSGVHFFEPHKAAQKVIAAGLIKLGILQEGQDVGEYFMHGTSHFLGMDVHDVSDRWMLEPGMILTVEPGIYIAEGSNCDPKWWNIGIRIEDDILVTKSGPVNLSKDLERTADEIEQLMKEEPVYTRK